MVYEFDWDAGHIRQVLTRLGYEKVEGCVFRENFEVWLLNGDVELDVQIPLVREAPDYQRLCDRCVVRVVEHSLVSLECMQEVVGVLLDVRGAGGSVPA